ncbi:MAG: (Fe-S)-binding protein, partial [Proteobacteria bacterium]|nr:(Fe-S)-binding protein [Pseudomonadota bacterium]
MLAFFILFCIGVFVFSLEVAQHVRSIRGGRASLKADHVRLRVRHTLAAALGQHAVRERWWGYAHLVISYAFIVFLFATVELLVQCVVPSFDIGDVIGLTAAGIAHLIQTYFAYMTLVAVVILGVRRFVRRHTLRSTWEAWVILGLIALIMLTHLGVMVAVLSNGGEGAWFGRYMPIEAYFARDLSSYALPDGTVVFAPGVDHRAYLLYLFCAALHIVCVSGFLVLIPRGKHLHILFAFANLFFEHRGYDVAGKPIDGAEPVDMISFEAALEEAAEKDVSEDEWPALGASRVRDLPSRMLLNSFSCTQCQRCTDACPMVAARLEGCEGPMETMIRLRGLCKRSDAALLGAEGSLLEERELWACTQCGACDRACAVGSKHTPRIIELRRALVYREKHPKKLNEVFRYIERAGNPWGYARAERNAWQSCLADALPEDVPSPKQKIFVFAGCMGAYDRASRKTLQDMVMFLRRSGYEVSASERETCCGEMLQAVGNEAGFDACRQANLAEFKKHSHDVILTICPHCAQVLRERYGSEREPLCAMHFLEFMAELWCAGRLRMRDAVNAGHYVAHVPCGLGKKSYWAREVVSLVRALGVDV